MHAEDGETTAPLSNHANKRHYKPLPCDDIGKGGWDRLMRDPIAAIERGDFDEAAKCTGSMRKLLIPSYSPAEWTADVNECNDRAARLRDPLNNDPVFRELLGIRKYCRVEEKARGFSAEELDELARAKKEGRLQIIPKAEFPDNPVRDPARRSSKIAEEVAAAPDKTYETRERSVRTSKGSVDAAPYLSNLYTNEDGQMVCQGCHREMPFKKRDGKPYFEAVEAFGREHVNKEHPAQHLALCPLCAAKFKEYVKRDAKAQESLKEDILTTPEKQFEFDLVLDIPARFRFTERHLLDIRSVLSTQVQTGV